MLAPEVMQRVLAENLGLARECGGVLEVRHQASQSARKVWFQE